MMVSLGHALYKGDIYVKLPSAKFTYVLMMSAESYINKLMVSEITGEEIVKFSKRMIEIISHPQCEVIRQTRFDWDLTEVQDEYCFSVRKRDFIECPIDTKDIGIVSPGAYAPNYNSKEDPVPLYFKESIENFFPNLATRINFLNKYYQCFNSGKISAQMSQACGCWPKGFRKIHLGFCPFINNTFQVYCIDNKKKAFSTAMINSDTQLVFLDEWSPEHLQSDTAKLLLQGGVMISAVKYEKARTFINNSAFYITTNNVPNFGKDEDANVKRRLKIFETKSIQNPSSKIEPCMVSPEFYALHCLDGK